MCKDACDGAIPFTPPPPARRIDVSLYTVIKSGGLAWTYILSLAALRQWPRWDISAAIVGIVTGVGMATWKAHGEEARVVDVEGWWWGVVATVLSSVASATRWVLSERYMVRQQQQASLPSAAVAAAAAHQLPSQGARAGGGGSKLTSGAEDEERRGGGGGYGGADEEVGASGGAGDGERRAGGGGDDDRAALLSPPQPPPRAPEGGQLVAPAARPSPALAPASSVPGFANATPANDHAASLEVVEEEEEGSDTVSLVVYRRGGRGGSAPHVLSTGRRAPDEACGDAALSGMGVASPAPAVDALASTLAARPPVTPAVAVALVPAGPTTPTDAAAVAQPQPMQDASRPPRPPHRGSPPAVVMSLVALQAPFVVLCLLPGVAVEAPAVAAALAEPEQAGCGWGAGSGQVLALLAGFGVGGGVLAFLMLAVELQLVVATSALTLNVIGHLKDLVAIVAAVAVFGEHITLVNGVGMALTLAAATVYSARVRAAR
jgi:drug/metabolite transporter (DMT)-like permease